MLSDRTRSVSIFERQRSRFRPQGVRLVEHRVAPWMFNLDLTSGPQTAHHHFAGRIRVSPAERLARHVPIRRAGPLRSLLPSRAFADPPFLWIAHLSVTRRLLVPCVYLRADDPTCPHSRLPRSKVPPDERGFYWPLERDQIRPCERSVRFAHTERF
jgi:hypothetical protein